MLELFVKSLPRSAPLVVSTFCLGQHVTPSTVHCAFDVTNDPPSERGTHAAHPCAANVVHGLGTLKVLDPLGVMELATFLANLSAGQESDKRLACSNGGAEIVPLIASMGVPEREGDSSSDDGVVPKAFPEAVITDQSLFKRTGGKTFETESLEQFYKPIDSYEGAHRFDPKFEWEKKEERRVVRKVSHLVASCLLRAS